MPTTIGLSPNPKFRDYSGLVTKIPENGLPTRKKPPLNALAVDAG